MMKLIGVGRIGRDVELRYTGSGEPVANISLAWNYGQKDRSGKKPTQWVDATLFGKRAESLAPYLKKGVTLFIDLRDVHVSTFKTKDGTQNSKLTGIIDGVEFAGDRLKESPPSASGRRHDPDNNPDSFDDSIPF
jgi:single-strand DNA-binding protein